MGVNKTILKTSGYLLDCDSYDKMIKAIKASLETQFANECKAFVCPQQQQQHTIINSNKRKAGTASTEKDEQEDDASDGAEERPQQRQKVETDGSSVVTEAAKKKATTKKIPDPNLCEEECKTCQAFVDRWYGMLDGTEWGDGDGQNMVFRQDGYGYHNWDVTPYLYVLICMPVNNHSCQYPSPDPRVLMDYQKVGGAAELGGARHPSVDNLFCITFGEYEMSPEQREDLAKKTSANKDYDPKLSQLLHDRDELQAHLRADKDCVMSALVADRLDAYHKEFQYAFYDENEREPCPDVFSHWLFTYHH